MRQKTSTPGEGGFVTTNNDALADEMRMVRNQGQASKIQPENDGLQFPNAGDECCNGSRAVEISGRLE